MNKDTAFLQEAYAFILEKKSNKKSDKKDKSKWVPPWIKSKKKEEEDTKETEKKPTRKSMINDELEVIYQEILESKHINKKFARRYNRVTADLLKADTGSKVYMKLKNERDDLISILKDHGKTPADLDELLTKKEIEEVKSEEPANGNESTTCTHCGDGYHSKDNCPENC